MVPPLGGGSLGPVRLTAHWGRPLNCANAAPARARRGRTEAVFMVTIGSVQRCEWDFGATRTSRCFDAGCRISIHFLVFDGFRGSIAAEYRIQSKGQARLEREESYHALCKVRIRISLPLCLGCWVPELWYRTGRTYVLRTRTLGMYNIGQGNYVLYLISTVALGGNWNGERLQGGPGSATPATKIGKRTASYVFGFLLGRRPVQTEFCEDKLGRLAIFLP